MQNEIDQIKQQYKGHRAKMGGMWWRIIDIGEEVCCLPKPMRRIILYLYAASGITTKVEVHRDKLIKKSPGPLNILFDWLDEKIIIYAN